MQIKLRAEGNGTTRVFKGKCLGQGGGLRKKETLDRQDQRPRLAHPDTQRMGCHSAFYHFPLLSAILLKILQVATYCSAVITHGTECRQSIFNNH